MRLGLKLSGAEATALSARFFRADRRLDGHVQFGFVLPEYRPRCGRPVRRLPTARAAVYYAADVKHGTTGRLTTGLFCEGPHSRGFDIASESGEIVGLKIRAGALQALLGVPAKELRDATLPMEELWGRSAAVVTEQLSAAPNPTARARILQSELIRRCQ